MRRIKEILNADDAAVEIHELHNEEAANINISSCTWLEVFNVQIFTNLIVYITKDKVVR